jgi:hypothetical protein
MLTSPVVMKPKSSLLDYHAPVESNSQFHTVSVRCILTLSSHLLPDLQSGLTKHEAEHDCSEVRGKATPHLRTSLYEGCLAASLIIPTLTGQNHE